MATKAAVTRHDLHAFLQQPATANQSLVVLNSESCGAPPPEKLWDASDYVFCADGRANRAHDLLGADRAPHAAVGALHRAPAAPPALPRPGRRGSPPARTASRACLA